MALSYNTRRVDTARSPRPDLPPPSLSVSQISKGIADIQLEGGDFIPSSIPPPNAGAQNDGLEVVECPKLTELGYGKTFMRKYLADSFVADAEIIAAEVRNSVAVYGLNHWYTIRLHF